LPFFKSLPGKWLSIATSLIVLFVLAIPVMPFASLFGFVRLPLPFYGWMLLIISCYIISAELAKRWFYKKLQNQS
jgi:Mg2+-importing ATPase